MKGHTHFKNLRAYLGEDHYFVQIVLMLRLKPASWRIWEDYLGNRWKLKKYTPMIIWKQNLPDRMPDIYYKSPPENLLLGAEQCLALQAENYQLLIFKDYWKVRLCYFKDGILQPNQSLLGLDPEFLKNMVFAFQGKKFEFKQVKMAWDFVKKIDIYCLLDLKNDKLTIEQILQKLNG